MMTFFGIIVGYIVIGTWLAIRGIPGFWERARANEEFRESQKDVVKENVIVTFLMWPVVIPVRAVRGVIDRVVDKADPRSREWELEKQALEAERVRAEQQERIEELETILGFID